MNPGVEEMRSAIEGWLASVAPEAPRAASPSAGTVSAEAASPSPVSPVGCQVVDAGRRGYHLDLTVPPDQLVAAATLLAGQGFAIDTITGVDWLAAGEMEVVYDFFHFASPVHVVMRTRVSRENAEVPTLSGVYPGANWHERETHDFFGIRFRGHPDLTPLLLPEDATFHPLRKDFTGAD